MAMYKRKPDYFETEEGREVVRVLRTMSRDATYHTGTSYSSNTDLYPDHQIPFVEKHMEYLRNHPSTNPTHYLSNLRIMHRSN